ncbi:MAG: lipid-A-disaccharide synthase, partial [Bacteroidales bacterium]
MKLYIIAGEASGDLHGSNLVKGLKDVDPSIEIRGIGGQNMKEAGADIWRDYKDTAVMGFTAVVSHLGKIARNMRECRQDILRYSPDAVILIDYPG